MRLLSEVVELGDPGAIVNSIRRLLPTAQAFVRDDEPPVNVVTDKWLTSSNPTRLVRCFKFTDHRVLTAFVSEMLDMERSTGHSGRITISGKDVVVEVWTHEVQDVTAIDIRYAETTDDIYDDVRHYFV